MGTDGLNAANDEPTAEERRDAEGWYGNNKPVIKTGVQVYHYHNDHLGTPNELTDQQGEVVWYADYEAWGNTAKFEWKEQRIDNIVVSEEHLQPIRFQGQSFDEETGLHYNRFRYFDPDVGMFTTRDPIGLMGGTNVFQYAPNPVGWIDPFGLTRTIPDKVPGLDGKSGVYVLTNDTLGTGYVGSGVDAGSRLGNSRHKKAQDLLSHPDTKVKFRSVDTGTATGRDRSNILRHYEQIEKGKAQKKYTLTNSNNPEATIKNSRNTKLVETHGAGSSPKKTGYDISLGENKC